MVLFKPKIGGPLMRLFPAHAAEPGMEVPRHNPFAPHHVVQSVEFTSDPDVLLVKTSQGSWAFGPNELLDFPRREDGSTRDWTLDPDHPPTATDLHVGDVIAPASTQHPGNPRLSPSWDGWSPSQQQTALRVWANDCRRVARVSRHGASIDLLDVTVTQPGVATQRLTFHVREAISGGQRVATRERARAVRLAQADRATTVPETFGPYVQRADNSLVMIAVHPGGRGRWPVEIERGLLEDRGMKIVRPPKTRLGWGDVVFCGGDKWARHPRDPHWGLKDGEPLPDDDV